MVSRFKWIIIATLLSSCSAVTKVYDFAIGPPNWRPYQVLDEERPLRQTSSTSDVLLTAYNAAESLAKFDNFLIASGLAKPRRATNGSMNNTYFDFASIVLPEIPHSAPKKYLGELIEAPIPVRTLETNAYSPLDFTQSANCTDPPPPPPSLISSKPVAKPKATTTTTTESWTISFSTQSSFTIKTPDGQLIQQTLPGTPAPPVDPATLLEKVNTEQSKTKSGCSYSSVHARQMALAGFKLADSFCHDFFDKKRIIQNGNNVISDFASGSTSLAGAVGGLLTGSPAAPAAIGALVGITNQATALTNKDFLFGSDNIDNIYQLVSNAGITDTTTVFPDPDISEWNYNLAVGTIRKHQEICNPAYILSLVKQSIQNTTIQSSDANGNTTTGCSKSGSPQVNSVGVNNRPSTKATTVSVAANPACGSKSSLAVPAQ